MGQVFIIDDEEPQAVEPVELEGDAEVVEEYVSVLWRFVAVIVFFGDVENEIGACPGDSDGVDFAEGDFAFDLFAGKVVHV